MKMFKFVGKVPPGCEAAFAESKRMDMVPDPVRVMIRVDVGEIDIRGLDDRPIALDEILKAIGDAIRDVPEDLKGSVKVDLQSDYEEYYFATLKLRLFYERLETDEDRLKRATEAAERERLHRESHERIERAALERLKLKYDGF